MLKASFKALANRLRSLIRDAIRQEIDERVLPRIDQLERQGADLAGRYAVPIGTQELMMMSPSGPVLVPSDDLAVVACFCHGGDLEPGTRLFISRALAPGECFVDIGANLGIMTLAAARALEGKGKIHAFEPFPKTRRLLERTVWANGHQDLVTIHSMAVSNRTGKHKLHIGSTCGHNSLFPLEVSGLANAPLEDMGGSVEVDLTRLDEVIRPGSPVHLIKIDAEGAELDVIEGAVPLLRSLEDVALIVEFGPTHLKRIGMTTEQWLKPFRDLGMDYRAIHARTGELESLSVAQLDAAFSENLFFARPGSQPWRKLVAPKT